MRFNSTVFKKLCLLIMNVIIIFTICACNKPKKLDIDDIYVIDDGVFQYKTNDLNYKNIILDKTTLLFDSTIEATRTEKINGNEYQLEYCETLSFAITGKKVHKYLINGTEDHFIYFNSDGTLDSILFEFAKLDILPTASAETVQTLIIEELKGIVDLSKYEYIDIFGNNKEHKGKFGIYDFLYYNMNNGYMTDYLKVSVSDEGSIFGFSINNASVDIPPLTIDKKLEDKLLSEKLNNIYNNSSKIYKSYSMAFKPLVVLYDNELCIEYFVSVNYTDIKGGSETSDYIIRLLMPVHLVSDVNK